MTVETGKFKGPNINKFKDFLDKEIGTEYEEIGGYFTIYDIETKAEFKQIQEGAKKFGEIYE